MSKSISGTATWTSTAVVPTDADGVTGISVETPVQTCMNREEFLYNLTTSTGVKVMRTIADVAALKELTGMANNEVCLVDSLNAVYAFDSGDATAADDVMIVAPTSGTGRWRHSSSRVGGIASGLARLNSAGKVLEYSPNRIVEVTNSASTVRQEVTSTSYITVLTRTITAPGALAGDKVKITVYAVLGANSGTSSGNTARICVVENAGAEIEIAETVRNYPEGTATVYAPCALRTVATGGSFEVRLQLKSGAAGIAAFVNANYSIVVEVVRP